MNIQRYVTDELIHFVGRGLPDDKSQFDLLVMILRSGELRVPRDEKGASKAPVQTNLTGGWFSERKIHEVAAVCFCDIPEPDLTIHMRKYSRFGVSFSKAFLLSKGATPVFYIANDAKVTYEPHVDWASGLLPAGIYSRAFFLNSLINVFYAKRTELLFLMIKQDQESTPVEEKQPPKVAELLAEIEMLMMGIDREFLSYCVPFEVSQSHDAIDNFYMEREWRTLSDVRFHIEDVYRILLPRGWATLFRAAFPEYSAQMVFSD